jgi:hypothetical protein
MIAAFFVVATFVAGYVDVSVLVLSSASLLIGICCFCLRAYGLWGF